MDSEELKDEYGIWRYIIIIALMHGLVVYLRVTHYCSCFHRWLKTVSEYGVCLLKGVACTTKGGLEVSFILIQQVFPFLLKNQDHQESVTSPSRNLLWRGKDT